MSKHEYTPPQLSAEEAKTVARKYKEDMINVWMRQKMSRQEAEDKFKTMYPEKDLAIQYATGEAELTQIK